jgi:hypothetical protein
MVFPPSSRSLRGVERQARHRQRRAEGRASPARRKTPVPPLTRPRRWRAAVAELIALQAEYTAWLDALPEPLRDTATGEALQAIVDLDELVAVEPPRGFGRD